MCFHSFLVLVCQVLEFITQWSCFVCYFFKQKYTYTAKRRKPEENDDKTGIFCKQIKELVPFASVAAISVLRFRKMYLSVQYVTMLDAITWILLFFVYVVAGKLCFCFYFSFCRRPIKEKHHENHNNSHLSYELYNLRCLVSFLDNYPELCTRPMNLTYVDEFLTGKWFSLLINSCSLAS